MKKLARVVTTAVALAAFSILLAGVAHAGSPQADQRSVGRWHATGPRHDTVWRCNAGHGPQFDCRNAGPLPGRQGLAEQGLVSQRKALYQSELERNLQLRNQPAQPSPGPSASTPAGRGGQLDPARSAVMLGLLVALAAGGYWLRRRHRPREAI
jgi:hypothetical protein